MLVLARKVGERVLIGDKIMVTVVKVGPGGVRLGIEAPPELPVVREELADKIAADQAAEITAASLKAAEIEAASNGKAT